MAAELESIISEYLDELPAEHPDRRYLESLRSSLRTFIAYDRGAREDVRRARPLAQATNLAALHINLAEQAIEFEDRHGTVGRLRFGSEAVLYEGEPLLLTPTPAGPDSYYGNGAATHGRHKRPPQPTADR